MKRRRHRQPVKQTHPSYQALLARHRQGLNLSQEFGRRKNNPPSPKDEAEFKAFQKLSKIYE